MPSFATAFSSALLQRPIISRLLKSGLFAALGMGAMLPGQLPAADLSYRELIEFDHGSRLPGIPKGSRYIVDFVLNGEVPDTDHSFFENSFENTAGYRGITTFGNFTNPFRFLRFTLDPSGPTALDLANLVFAYGQVNGDFSRVVDANQPPPTLKPPCDITPCINEHITLEMRGISGSPITQVWFNLYNSTFYNPSYATRQLLLDVSDPNSPPSGLRISLSTDPKRLRNF